MIIKEILSALENAEGPVVKVFNQSGQVKVFGLGFKKGMLLKEHSTAVPAKLVVLEGCVLYKQADRSVTLNKFEDLDIPLDIVHSVEALDDSICFLMKG